MVSLVCQKSDEVTESPGKYRSRMEKEAIEGKGMNEVQELKDNLLRRYSGYIINLKHEISKKKKKEKLPKEAKQILLAWWNINCKWPYPTKQGSHKECKANNLHGHIFDPSPRWSSTRRFFTSSHGEKRTLRMWQYPKSRNFSISTTKSWTSY
ncbi:hypothetical protein AAZX31_15G241000 [Glycine max]|uniref:ELK domain-containing protein n=2 Tax=Glycine subgen. Soja TaxID=1462606 RepID=A0A0R0G6N9_SOYBN|nr:homeobox protein KNOX3 [Glycine max]XP_028203503.1 homeobox protein KNOX3-like [Glycine soja]XP_028203504.1 homeobox protein KNOX3-like [Glycine soja]XP_040865463.1 homeobox protein KNOX3 [Glycine max]KAH1148855.1 hypothetical protein GYH30_043473 [Glycine max]KRH13703.1 hypothetical protein GLYMA_15G257800v4 [Glycine max]RZB66284.1 Homeobox protein knotted-1-like 10 [Glycine soja]|eukprot:XP_006598209.1 homeobox protein KNOX3 [Glycine max]